MKPFDIELAKQGKPVCTRDGRPVRILCYDFKSLENTPIVALIRLNEHQEGVVHYYIDGKHFENGINDLDLMMVSGQKEGWINVCRDREDNKPFCHHGKIFETKEDARAYLKQMATMAPKTFPNVIETVQIYWEE
jgi:hypothetical protein